MRSQRKKKHLIKSKKKKAKAKAKAEAKGDAEYKCVIPDDFEFDFNNELKENDSWKNFSSRVWHKTRAQLTEHGLDAVDAKRGACQVNWWMAKPWFNNMEVAKPWFNNREERLEKPS